MVNAHRMSDSFELILYEMLTYCTSKLSQLIEIEESSVKLSDSLTVLNI